jgi:glycosyltransferase involved in cell wall biosynthesis
MAIACKWVGALFDSSGYASASRGYINTLLDTGQIELSLGALTFEQQRTTHTQFHHRVKDLIDKPLPHKIQISHLTPENYPSHKSKTAYNIGYTAWETSRLPDSWVPLINLMDEVWVPSKWNRDVFKQSGVNIPIIVIPHMIPMPDLANAKAPDISVSPDTYIFYSIFQWLERKNPVGLLKAYLTEFGPHEKVALAIKSYRIDSSTKEQQVIKDDISRLKKSLQLTEYPQVLFFGNLLPDEYMKGFHNRCNCYVTAHRGEGFGIPIAGAMSYGKPVIATGYSGVMEFMNKDNSFPISYMETPVNNMIFPNYHGHMNWAEPNIPEMKQRMRWCFEHQNEAKEIGKRAKKSIEDNFSSKVIGDMMVQRLSEIEKGL